LIFSSLIFSFLPSVQRLRSTLFNSKHVYIATTNPHFLENQKKNLKNTNLQVLIFNSDFDFHKAVF